MRTELAAIFATAMPSRSIAIVSLRYPLSRDTLSAIPAIPQQVAFPPLLVPCFTQTYQCDTPFCNFSRDTCAIAQENSQRRRDDNRKSFAIFRGGGGRCWGQRGKLPQKASSLGNAIFLGKRHDNKKLNLKILLSRNFVVMAQAPKQAQNNVFAILSLKASRDMKTV